MKRCSEVTALLALGSLSFVLPPTLNPQVDTVAVNDVSLHYDVEGRGEPLVLIHGFAVHLGYWDNVVEPLARHYTVIRYDRRGYGESGGRPDPTADPADLAALLERLGHSRAHVMGHSAGTRTALTFAVRYPEMVDGLVLFGPGPPEGFGLPRNPGGATPFAEWARIARGHGIDSVKSLIRAMALSEFGERSPDVIGRDLMESWKGLELLDPAPPSNMVELARIDELHAVEAPTLVIIGKGEGAYTHIVADALVHGIPDARKVVIPGGGHVVSWSEPERFVAEVLRFLRAANGAP